MKIKVGLLLIVVFIITSCDNEYKLRLETPKKVAENGKFTVKVTEKNNQAIDSVLFSLNGKKASTNTTFDLSNERMGVHVISAIVFYKDKNKKLTNTVLHLPKNKPAIYKYEIVNEYPHDANAFTQGLEFHNGFIYESTGQYNESSLRKVELTTGKVLQKISLEKDIFAEGMTIKDNKIYQLTWKAGEGYIYDVADFKFLNSFPYNRSIEGWGLSHNKTHLIKTDGTEKMWFLNADTQKEEHYIETYTNKVKIEKLNELEYIDGKIFANVWQKNYILIVNPTNGAIEGILDLNGLQAKAGQRGLENVLNGIAYDSENKRLFVTGKKWNKLFEIKWYKKQ